jgi:hypothetical protein
MLKADERDERDHDRQYGRGRGGDIREGKPPRPAARPSPTRLIAPAGVLARRRPHPVKNVRSHDEVIELCTELDSDSIGQLLVTQHCETSI